MLRLEKLWVSKLMDKQEGTWQPAAGKSSTSKEFQQVAKEGVAIKRGSNKKSTEMLTTAKVASRKGSTTNKGVRERWEQAPRKEAGVGNAGVESNVKKFEVKNMKTIQEGQTGEVRAREGRKEEGSVEEKEAEGIIQLDGNAEVNGSSDEDDELGELDDDSDDEDSEGSDESSEDEGENLGDELGSDDDISDEDASTFVYLATMSL